jgi:hypothetical protein
MSPTIGGKNYSFSKKDLFTCEANKTYEFTATYLGSGDSDFSISAYVKNITDDYRRLFAAATGPTMGSITITAPRTYGIILSVRY